MIAGIFVGGAGTRMGGRPKGLLPTAGGATIVERWQALLEPLAIPMVLVGAGPAYARLGIEAIADQPPGIGPLGGLVALLCRAGRAHALAFAGDMPFVSRALVERLACASESAAIIAPRRAGRWEPLCARYDAPRVLPIARARVGSSDHSLQRVLGDARALEIALAPSEIRELRDWDTPDDMTPGRSG